MLAKVNSRLILLMAPIALCCLLQFCDNTNFITSSDMNTIEYIIPWLFAIGCAMILPNRNRLWMIIGTTISYCIIYNILSQLEPSTEVSGILSSFCGPLTTLIFAPKMGRKKKSVHAFFINYSLAIIFVIITSILLSFGLSLIYDIIKDSFNSVFLNTVYDANFSFVYSILYQFCHTFGLGEFVKELRAISPFAPTSISFYATSIAINFAVIPAIFAAIFICQPKKRRVLYGIFLIISFIGSTSNQAVSYLLLSLLWLYPSLFAHYLLICLLLYFLGQYVDFKVLILPQSFYEPNLRLEAINLIDSKFIMFCAFSFLITIVSATILIIQDKKYTKQTGNIKRVKAITISVVEDSQDADYTITAVNIIKLLGGFNNIITVMHKNNSLNASVIDAKNVKIDELISLGYLKEKIDTNKHLITLSIKTHAAEITRKISAFAERVYIDIDTEYRDMPHYRMENNLADHKPQK